MAVEVDARPGPAPVAARHHVGARIAGGIAPLALGAMVAHLEAARLEPRAEELRAGRVGLARRIDGGKADEIAGEGDEIFALGLDAGEASVVHRRAHRSTRPPSASRTARPVKKRPAMPPTQRAKRPEERRAGQVWGSTCRSRR